MLKILDGVLLPARAELGVVLADELLEHARRDRRGFEILAPAARVAVGVERGEGLGELRREVARRVRGGGGEDFLTVPSVRFVQERHLFQHL